jgi:hypothetical protein
MRAGFWFKGPIKAFDSPKKRSPSGSAFYSHSMQSCGALSSGVKATIIRLIEACKSRCFLSGMTRIKALSEPKLLLTFLAFINGKQYIVPHG